MKLFNQPEMPNYDMMIAYDSQGRQEYIGFASAGAATNAEKWQIYKLSYDSNGRLEKRRYAGSKDDFNKAWSSRASYSYTDI